MKADMPKSGTLARVRCALRVLRAQQAWARTAGEHVIIGIQGGEAFARITPIGPPGSGHYGLAFRAEDSQRGGWEPMLLVDGLSDVVEHALIAEGAVAAESSAA